ncbi:MAG: hypothetical protein ACO1TE_29145 [Prosthecobacter sp.]
MSLFPNQQSKTPQFIERTATPLPPRRPLPAFPPLPPGFDRWAYRGVKWASGRAVMVTSWDETTDDEWDPPMMFQTRGDEHTYYLEAIIDHCFICKCADCASVK